MKVGKIDGELLKKLVFGKTGAAREEVLVGPGIGEDCAVLDFGDFDCVLSSDPITASTDLVGRFAVHVACNDIAAAGARPIAIMLTVLLPPEASEAELAEIATQADEAAKEIGVMIVGGHTEVSAAVTKPLISATAIGRSEAGSRRARRAPAPGDVILVTKSLGLEGTAIAAEAATERLQNTLTGDEIERARAFLELISVVKEGRVAAEVGFLDMHDITEGGVLGAVYEVCELAGVGGEIYMADLPFDALTLAVCAELDLDPLRLISSGSMLIVTGKEDAGALIDALEEEGIAANVIGLLTKPEEGIHLVDRSGTAEVIEPPGPDEIYKIV